MENMFVWVLIFAGAAIALLGLFLVASERELKNKRLEIEALLAKLGDNGGERAPAPTLLTQPIDGDVAELQQKNQELQGEIANLSAKLELSRRAIEELESAGPQESNAQAGLQQLQTTNEALAREIANLKEQLQTYEARAKEASAENQDAARRQRELQNEISELQEKLAASQNTIREMESARQSRVSAESLEANHAEEQRQLQNKIVDLESQLSDAREKLGESETLRRRVAELETLLQELAEENHRYEQDIPRWQARIAEAEENRLRLSGLREPFDALLARHAEVIEGQKRFEEDLAAFGGLMALPVKEAAETDGVEAPTHNASYATPTTANFGRPTLISRAADSSDGRSAGDEDDAIVPPPEQIAAAGPSNKPRKRRFGLFVLTILLPVAAAFAFGMWNAPADRGESGAVKTSATARKIDPGQGSAKTQDLARAVKGPATAAKPPQTGRGEANVSGTYEVTRPSRVYAAPTEYATLIGDIEPGAKVYVVNARDGWLEIHSKHGRPPGYIRKEAAAPVTGQN